MAKARSAGAKRKKADPVRWNSTKAQDAENTRIGEIKNLIHDETRLMRAEFQVRIEGLEAAESHFMQSVLLLEKGWTSDLDWMKSRIVRIQNALRTMQPSNFKHGPDGLGGPGACDAGCITPGEWREPPEEPAAVASTGQPELRIGSEDWRDCAQRLRRGADELENEIATRTLELAARNKLLNKLLATLGETQRSGVTMSTEQLVEFSKNHIPVAILEGRITACRCGREFSATPEVDTSVLFVRHIADLVAHGVVA